MHAFKAEQNGDLQRKPSYQYSSEQRQGGESGFFGEVASEEDIDANQEVDGDGDESEPDYKGESNQRKARLADNIEEEDDDYELKILA